MKRIKNLLIIRIIDVFFFFSSLKRVILPVKVGQKNKKPDPSSKYTKISILEKLVLTGSKVSRQKKYKSNKKRS